MAIVISRLTHYAAISLLGVHPMAIVTLENRLLYKTEKVREILARPPTSCTKVGEVTFGKVGVAKFFRQGYVPESRTKPENLILNMTGRTQIMRSLHWGSQYYQDSLGSTAGEYGCTRRTWSRGLPTINYGSAPPTTGWETKAREQVLTDTVNIAQNVFEYRQTASLFSDVASMVNDVWEQYRGRKRFRRKVTVANVAGAKLTASFGIVPLLSDLQKSLDVLNARLGPNVLVKHIGGGATGNRDVTVSFNLTHCSGWGSWDRSERWSIWVAYDISPHRVSMGNPLSLAWEVVPWSWLVDGLVDVGGWLASLDALQGVKWMKGTLTTKDRISVSHNYKGSALMVSSREGQYREQRYSRGVISTIPLPPRPRWVASSNWSKVVNATAALVSQRSTPEYVNFDWRKPSKLSKDTRRQLRRFFYHFKAS